MKTPMCAAMALGAVALMGGVAAADTRVIPVTEILFVEASGPFRVEITTGPQTSAVLEGSAAELERIESRVRGNRLQVRTRTSFNNNDDIDVVLRVTAPILQGITVSKGGSATATGLNTSAIRLDASMGAALDASGRCDRLEARARMGGALDAEKLVCRNVSANASMGGATHVHATGSVDAHASMGGTIAIAGQPAQHDASAFMGGIIDDD
jgi:Putative auto-transporter adhesin, head GIN domain